MPDPRPDVLPTRLLAESRHVGGPGCSVELGASRVDEGSLRYRYAIDEPPPGHAPPPIVIDLEPSAEAWRDFRSALDALGTWSWGPEHLPAAAAAAPPGPGHAWFFAVTWDGRVLDTGGWSAYPGSDGSPEPSRAFIEWCRAVRALAGGRPFA